MLSENIREVEFKEKMEMIKVALYNQNVSISIEYRWFEILKDLLKMWKMNKKRFLSGVMIFFLRIFVIYGIDIYLGNINGNPIEIVLNLYSNGV